MEKACPARALVMPYIVVGWQMVVFGVLCRGVVGPNTAMVEGAYTRRLCCAASSSTFCSRWHAQRSKHSGTQATTDVCVRLSMPCSHHGIATRWESGIWHLASGSACMLGHWCAAGQRGRLTHLDADGVDLQRQLWVALPDGCTGKG